MVHRATAHLVTENVAQTNLFLYEPTLIGQVADLVQPQSNIDESIIASAFWALDAFAHHRNKTGEVLTSVNASVAHGTLMNHFRGLVKRLSNDEGELGSVKVLQEVLLMRGLFGSRCASSVDGRYLDIHLLCGINPDL